MAHKASVDGIVRSLEQLADVLRAARRVRDTLAVHWRLRLNLEGIAGAYPAVQDALAGRPTANLGVENIEAIAEAARQMPESAAAALAEALLVYTGPAWQAVRSDVESLDWYARQLHEPEPGSWRRSVLAGQGLAEKIGPGAAERYWRTLRYLARAQRCAAALAEAALEIGAAEDALNCTELLGPLAMGSEADYPLRVQFLYGLDNDWLRINVAWRVYNTTWMACSATPEQTPLAALWLVNSHGSAPNIAMRAQHWLRAALAEVRRWRREPERPGALDVLSRLGKL